MKRFVISLVLTMMLVPTVTMAGAPRCQSAMLSEDLERGLKPAYVEKYLTEKNTNKVIEIQNQSPITDQGRRGFCHMYAIYEEFVHEYKARHDGKDPNISIYYWAYFHWLGRAIETAKDSKAGLEIPEGSWYENTFDLVKKYGVMTSDQWAQLGGRTDMQAATRNGIELGQLKTIVQRAHLEKSLLIALLKPELKKGQTRGNYFNSFLMKPELLQQLKNLVQRKTLALKQNETSLSLKQIKVLEDISKGLLRDRDLTANEIQSMVDALNQDIERIVRTEFSHIFFAKRNNPLDSIDIGKQVDLSRQMFPEVTQKTVSFVTDGARQGIFEYQGRNGDHLIFKTPLNKMLNLIKEEVDKGNSVWIGYEHNDYFVDGVTGAMTIEGMHTAPMSPHISRNERELSDLTYGGHATQIVGYELNPKSEIVALKMQNSWGTAAGKGGYYRMDMSYFRAYIWRITLRDETGEFTSEAIKKLDSLIKLRTSSKQ